MCDLLIPAGSMICLIRKKGRKRKEREEKLKQSRKRKGSRRGRLPQPRGGARGAAWPRPGLAMGAGPAPRGNGRTCRASRTLFTAAQPMGERGARSARPMGGRGGAFERRGASAGARAARRGPCAPRHARPPRRLRGAAHHRRRLLREVPQGAPQGRRKGEEEAEAAAARFWRCRASLPGAGGSPRRAERAALAAARARPLSRSLPRVFLPPQILVWKELDYGAMTESEKQMLVSEVNLLRELRHPNIVRYYDRIIDRSSTTLYIIMEYCDGGDLASLIAKCAKERHVECAWGIFGMSGTGLGQPGEKGNLHCNF